MSEDQWLPWSELMSFGLGHLRLNSQDFWAMSLQELDAAIEGRLGKSVMSTPFARDQLSQLMRDHPDQ